MAETITAVIFDLDHTLLTDHHLEHDVLVEMAAARGGETPDEAAVAAALSQFRDGGAPLDLALGDAFTRWGYDKCDLIEVAAEFRTRCLALVPQRVTALPGARELLAQLAGRGLAVAVLTNGWTSLQRAKAAQIGFTGPVFVSEEMRVWKPDPAAFAQTCDAIGCAPAASLYVGDDPEVDVVGAKRAGLRAAWADVGGAPASYPAGLPEPDATITSLFDLLSLLDGSA